MKIMVNGEAQQMQGRTLADLLIELGHGDAKLATAVNEDFVPAAARADCVLEPGDRVEILSARQGG
ncbi:sulfur carrier protein [Thalassovita litoralis]|jgi:sulfur carrier protein|uniref:Sulfur carrier protein n=2 Tax=Thalassovita litoralis TaxID=1010611 RepID=A0A521FRB9_9RHOB|nr:sulfur carrier protein ThiS [Thalassovita litoralis]SMO98604.1 sulfur carrier protein [Thalassovita litoralis]